MEENFDALDVIAQTRGKVKMDDQPTGNYLFPLWGVKRKIMLKKASFFTPILHQTWGLKFQVIDNELLI